MANITLNENPQLNLEMEAMTVNTEGHCDEWNRRHKQLLENDHYLSEEQKKNNEPEFTVAEKRENIASKEKMPKILGKIAKFFTDLKTVAFSGKYSDLDGKPAIVNNNTATEAGSALDARQANPTIEGTMANQISQLNSDLNNINGSLNLCVKQFTIPANESIAIPCLNCIIFYNGSNGGKFSIITTVGYASDTVRSRISYINGDASNGLKLSYSGEDTLDSKSGIFIIENTNPINSAKIAVIGIKSFSAM